MLVTNPEEIYPFWSDGGRFFRCFSTGFFRRWHVWWKWTPVEDLMDLSESSETNDFPPRFWNCREINRRFDQKRHGNLFPSSQGLQNLPVLIFWAIPLSSWSVTCFRPTAQSGQWHKWQTKNDGRWKMPCDICDFVKTRYVWMIFDESRKKLLFFFKWTFTILILEKVIDMLASKHGKNLMPNFACVVFLFNFSKILQKSRKFLIHQATKYWIVNQDYEALTSCDDGPSINLSQEITSEQWTFQLPPAFCPFCAPTSRRCRNWLGVRVSAVFFSTEADLERCLRDCLGRIPHMENTF